MAAYQTHAGIVIGVVAAIAVLGLVAAGLLSANQTIPSIGNVQAVGVGVYSDSACTRNVTSVNWGALEPGASTTSTVYVKNIGSTAVTLSMSTANWNSSQAQSYITMGWNRNGYTLAPGASVQAILTLSVSASISGVNGFSFDIIIAGTEST